MSAALFEFEDVRLTIDATVVLDGLSATIADGGITVLVGPSGSGKSTALRCCNRLEAPDSGLVAFRGVDVSTINPMSLRRKAAMVFQRPQPFAGTVLDNLRVAAPEITHRAAAAMIESLSLDASLLDRDAATLSGGEAQRMCLARALVTGPEVLLLDEPTSALDHESTTVLEHLARRLADGGMPMVWVTHDRAQVERIADAVVTIASGRAVTS